MQTFIRLVMVAVFCLLLIPSTAAQESTAITSDILNVRAGAGTGFAKLGQLERGTTVVMEAHDSAYNWVLIHTQDNTLRGWVASGFLILGSGVLLENLPTSTEVVGAAPAPAANPAQPAAVDAPPAAAPVVVYPSPLTNVTDNARQIYLSGVALGNRVNVFSKVGDSISVSTYFLEPLTWGIMKLRDYAYLQPTYAFFAARRARTGNSFANVSLANDNGWTSNDVLDVTKGNRRVCRRNETPLACEYRIVKPSIALIMFGTNDVASLSPDQFRANLTTIVQMSIERGIVPVLSTIPTRFGYEQATIDFSNIVWEVAAQFSVPVWDYGSAMRGLPAGGISPDGAHPSIPPSNFDGVVDFTPENLLYGYTLRNLQALQVLDTLRVSVLY